MCRAIDRTICWCAVAVMVVCAESRMASGDDVATYLAEHDLKYVLAVHYEQQLDDVTGERRDELLQTLADLYAQLLESTTQQQLRDHLEQRGRAILREAPSDSTDALRLALLRGPYRMAERIAERHRLRLADAAELEQARTALDETIPELLNIMERADASAGIMNRRIARAGGKQLAELSSQTDRILQRASQTRFLAAWALYYQAYLEDQPSSARRAEELFGVLLDPDVASVRPETVSIDLRAVESFSRSILGMALCRSQTSSSADAIRWLTLLEHESTVEALRQQVPVWAMTIHLEHNEYRQARNVLHQEFADSTRAPSVWLRLLAVYSAEDEDYDVAAVENVRLAVNGLAAQGELEHVLDLARLYGDELLGESGFVADYVNGVLAYNRAREAHGGDNPPAPDDVMPLYARAGEHFEAAIAETDASQFESAAAGSLRLIGLCRYFRGEFLAARDAFVQASDELPPEQAAEALWMAIAALDRVVRAGDNDSLRSELHALIDQFLNRYPSNQHAPELVVRRAATTGEADPDVVSELLAVPPGSAMYSEARRRAGEMLYALFRSSRGEQRAQFAGEFLGVVVPQIAESLPIDDVSATERALLLVRSRQVLEVALARGVERMVAAEQAVEAINTLRATDPDLVRKHRGEISFRQVQLHLMRDQLGEAVDLADTLWDADPTSTWAQLASRAVFQYAHDQHDTDILNQGSSADSLQLIVRFGGRVLREFEEDSSALSDRTVLSYHAVVADAAMKLWQQTRDKAMGRRALFLYETKLLAERPNNAGFLRSTGTLAERFDRMDLALDCWRRLVAGLPTDSDAWFEAKFHVLSILAQIDPDRARAVMDQHTSLNPAYGPDPWGARLRAIDERLSRDGQRSGGDD